MSTQSSGSQWRQNRSAAQEYATGAVAAAALAANSRVLRHPSFRLQLAKFDSDSETPPRDFLGTARIENVCQYQSRMHSKVRIMCNQQADGTRNADSLHDLRSGMEVEIFVGSISARCIAPAADDDAAATASTAGAARRGDTDSDVPLVRRERLDFDEFESEDEAIEWGVSPPVVAHTGALTCNP